MDAVTFYHVEPMLGVGMPLLITAVGNDNQEQWVGEMYLLLQDPGCTVLQMMVSVDGKKWPACDVKLDETYIEDELLQQARWRFALYRQDGGHDEKYGLMLRPVEIAKTSANALYAFWMQSECGEKLAQIRKQTRSPVLAAKLDLAALLPKFRYDPPSRAV